MIPTPSPNRCYAAITRKGINWTNLVNFRSNLVKSGVKMLRNKPNVGSFLRPEIKFHALLLTELAGLVRFGNGGLGCNTMYTQKDRLRARPPSVHRSELLI